MMYKIFTISILSFSVTICSTFAQGFGSTRSQSNIKGQAGGKSNQINPSSYVGGPFKLTDLFPSFSDRVSARNSVGRSYVPNPNKPEYFKSFGFKKLY